MPTHGCCPSIQPDSSPHPSAFPQPTHSRNLAHEVAKARPQAPNLSAPQPHTLAAHYSPESRNYLTLISGLPSQAKLREGYPNRNSSSERGIIWRPTFSFWKCLYCRMLSSPLKVHIIAWKTGITSRTGWVRGWGRGVLHFK